MLILIQNSLFLVANVLKVQQCVWQLENRMIQFKAIVYNSNAPLYIFSGESLLNICSMRISY